MDLMTLLSQLVLILFIGGSGLSCFAGEADYFTTRFPLQPGAKLREPGEDSTFTKIKSSFVIAPNKRNPLMALNLYDVADGTKNMNRTMNGYLDSAAAKTESCDSNLLEESILDLLGGQPIASIEKYSYAEAGASNYFPLQNDNKQGIVTQDSGIGFCCMNVIKLNGTLVSADKLGHFLQHGFEYFEVARKLSSDHSPPSSRMSPLMVTIAEGLSGPSAVLKFGDRQEGGLFGLAITASGIYSYADAVANFEGYQFWKNLIAGDKPYFKCTNNKWSRVRDFSWADYVNDGWDEGLNCNQIADPKKESVVNNRISELMVAYGRKVLSCPVEPEKCKAVLERYREQKDFLVHPHCQAASGVIGKFPEMLARKMAEEGNSSAATSSSSRGATK